jgi:AGCS family alanine or glycine:cation symporter
LEIIRRFVFWASDLVWGPWTILLLIGTGVYLTVRFRVPQVARLREALRNLAPAASAAARGALSPFQAFMTGLGASTGTGNIAGVATAIVSGGPGAVFWIWCYGFFATSIKLAEAVLAVRFRSQREDRLSTGPMHYLEQGLGKRWLGLTYAAIAGVAALTTTPFTQPNSVAVVFKSELGVPTWVIGCAMAVVVWSVMVGGVKSIGRVASRLAPSMVSLYLVCGLVVIVALAGRLPETLALVFRSAFSGEAVKGGALGTGMMVAMRYGLARGIYANEAGYGTAAVAYGTARTDRPVAQGLNAMVEVYIVSFVTSTVSALTVLLSGEWATSGLKSTALVARAFSTVIPQGGLLVLLCALLFGTSTLLGWGYYGEQFLHYVFGPRVVTPYRWVYAALAIVGATRSVDLVWAWGDLMNGLQIFPNLLGVLGLSGLVAAMLRRDPDVREPLPPEERAA